ncbi:MAG TPA: hypothetical protein VGD34_04545 [Kribbella sp.]
MFRRRLRLSAAIAAGLVFVASAAVSAPASAVARRAADDPVVDVTIDSFSPATPKPGQPVTITGRVTNTSSVTFENPQAIACLDDHRLTTRAQLAAIPAEDKAANNSCAGLDNAGSTTFQAFTAPLAPKATVKFQLVVPWAEWNITKKPGVYVVGVMFRGNFSDPDRKLIRVTAGRARTLMPVTDGTPTPRKVDTALVLPLRHRPTMLSSDRFANESLAQSMAPTGTLGRLLALGQQRNVTWLVDPAMLDEARQMRDGYRVVGANNQTRPGTGAKAVAAWLKAFDASRAKNPVVLLPYGDPDIGGLIDASGGLKDLVGQSRAATEQYNLGGQLFSSGLWLENGAVTSRNLAFASTGYAGAKTDDVNLVTSSSWPAANRPNLSPSPVHNVLTPEGPVQSVRTVIADSALTAGGPDTASASSPIQVRQRFAAETALLASTGTGAISVVAVPPRSWDPEGQATATLVQALSLPWITPVNLNNVLAGTPKPAATKAPPAPRTAPVLPGGQLDQLKQLGRATNTFVSLLTNADAADSNLRRAMLQAASHSWRGFPDEAQRFLTYELSSVNSQLGKVHLVTNSGAKGDRQIKVNLSAGKGTFPLTVANELEVSVRVGIQVSSANRTDLKIAPLQTKVLGAHQKATYQINASAEQNGLIRAEARVISAQQLPVGRSQELVIQAAQYGSVGWVLVGAAVALLFGTSAVRIYRRIRSERRNPSTSGAGSDALHPAPLDPQELNGTAEPEPAATEAVTDELQPLRIPADRANGVPENGTAEAGNGVPGQAPPTTQSLKEGVGTKDG